MLKKVVLISGGAAVGKTAVLKNIIPLLQSKDLALSVCKIDCVATRDGSVYQNMGIPHVVGISGDICPDHAATAAASKPFAASAAGALPSAGTHSPRA